MLQNEQTALFEAIFESSPDALFLATDEDDSAIFACNNQAVLMFDALSKDELLSQPLRRLRHTHNTTEEIRALSKILTEQGLVRAEIQYSTLRGRIFWGEYISKRIPVGQDYVRLIRVIDITERKLLEADLRHTNTILADAEQITQLGTWELDMNTRTITWSAETFRLYGLESNTAVVPQELFWSLIHPDDVSTLREAVSAVQSSGTPYKIEMRGLQPDGSYHFHEARGKAMRDNNGTIVKIIGTVRNINIDKRREAELIYNKEHLENIINNISEVVVQVSFAGIIEFVSQNWTVLMGDTVENALNRSLIDYVHPEDVPELYEIMLHSLEDDGMYPDRLTKQYRAWHQGLKEWRWHSANASKIRTPNGLPLHILATVRDITEEKATAEKLRRSEEFLSEAQNMAHLGSWYTDLKTNVTEWSDEMYRIYNLPTSATPYTAEEFLAGVHPNDKRWVSEKLNKSVNNQELGAIEFRILRHDGVMLWLDARVKPVIHPITKRTIALFGIVWDITERKLTEEQIRLLNLHLEERVQARTQEIGNKNTLLLAEIEERKRTTEALQRSQNNMRTLVESTNDSIWSIDNNYCFSTLNASFYSILRLVLKAKIDVGDSALIDILGISAHEWRINYTRVLQSERFSVTSHYELTGYAFDVEIAFSPIIGADNHVTGAVVFARDITERLFAEREVRERGALLNLILETVATGVALTNSNGVIIRVNQAFARLFGYKPDELIGQHYSIVVPHKRRALGELSFQKMLAERTKYSSVEIQLIKKDDTFVDVEVSQTVIANEEQELYVVSSVNNITERKQAEAEIRRALEQERELSAMQSRFVVMVSHEFRTPLTTIRASAQLLARSQGKWSPEKQQSYFDDIDDSVNAMTELLEDVLSWGKAHTRRIPFEPRQTDVFDLIQTIVDGFHVVEEYQNRIVVTFPANSNARNRYAILDGKLLRQILTNLLSNALKYSPADSRIVFEVVPDLRSISFHVKDSGIGIGEEDQKHLFEPFYRATNVGSITGTGLGLAIVKQAVELHGGTIHLTSTRGEGTEFIVVIPCTFEEMP